MSDASDIAIGLSDRRAVSKVWGARSMSMWGTRVSHDGDIYRQTDNILAREPKVCNGSFAWILACPRHVCFRSVSGRRADILNRQLMEWSGRAPAPPASE